MLSFIIVNYRSEAALTKCVSSIINTININDFEIIIFNNDLNKIGILKNNDYLKIIENGKNIGFGAGCNIASQKARGEFICFINPDTEIISNKTKEILNIFKKDSSIGIVAPELLSKDGAIEKWSFGKEPTINNLLRNNIFEKKMNARKNIDSPVDWVSGAAIFIKKNTFEKIGGFDEKFFMYFEDVDLCRRVRHEGLRIVRLPIFKIKHLGGFSFSDKITQKKNYYASQEYYFRKHFGLISFYLLKILRVFHI